MKKLSLLLVLLLFAVLGVRSQTNVVLPYTQDFSSLSSGNTTTANGSPTAVTTMPLGIDSVYFAYEAGGAIRIGDTANIEGGFLTRPINTGAAVLIKVTLKYVVLPEAVASSNRTAYLVVTYGGDNGFFPLKKIRHSWPVTAADFKTLTFYLSTSSTPSPLKIMTSSSSSFSLQTSVFIDDLSIEYACKVPDSLKITDIMTNSAKLSFHEYDDSVTSWQYVIDTITKLHTPDPSTLTPVTISSKSNIILSGLQENMGYQVFVRSMCPTGAPTDWSEAIEFKTECSPVSTIIEDFNSYQTALEEGGSFARIIPDCWKTITPKNNGIYPKLYKPSTSYYGYNSVAMVFSGKSPLYAILPKIDTPLNGIILKFKLDKTDQRGGIFQVGYMSDPKDASTFTAVANLNNTEYRKMVEKHVIFTNVDDNSGANRYIAFRYGDVGGVVQPGNCEYVVDDIEVSPAPSCLPVSNLAISNITSNSAEATFESSASSWEYILSTNGEINPDTVSASNRIAITTKNIALSNLNMNTQYNIWVRATCDSNDNSFWSSIAFRTECSAAKKGWSDDFSSANEDTHIPYCWTRVLEKDNSTSIYPEVTSISAYGKGKGLQFYTKGKSVLMMATPIFDEDLSRMQASFWLKNDEGSNPATFEVGVLKDLSDTSTFVAIERIERDNELWEYYDIPLTTAPSTHKYIALRMTNNNRKSANYFFDEIKVDTIPSCRRVKNAKAFFIGKDTVKITFDSSAAAWQYALTDNININSAEGLTAVDIANDTIAIGNLQPGKPYKVWLRSRCDSNTYSLWSMQPITFITACGEVSKGWKESFDISDANSNPYCWTKIKSYSSYPKVSAREGYLNKGSLMFMIGGKNNQGATNLVASPKFFDADTLSNMVVSFWLRFTNVSNLSKFEVGVMSDITDENSFMSLKDVTPTTTNWTMFEEALANVPSNYHYIAFRMTKTSQTGSPEYYLDDIEVNKNASCARPKDVAAHNIGTNTADISWLIGGSEVRWSLEYKKASSSNWTRVDNVAASSYTISGLEANTSYNARVRAVCSPLDSSLWTYYTTFKTLCNIDSLPFVEDFSSSSSYVFPPSECWGVYSAKASDIFAGGTMSQTSKQWTFSDNNRGIDSKKAIVNIHGTAVKSWLVTPVFAIDTNSNLEFDVAYTKNNSAEVADTSGIDDKFMVVISDDAGATWKSENAIVWSNDGQPTGAFSLNGIPNIPTPISIPLSQYIGKNIKIGFYVESTRKNADNDLHLDNIKVLKMSIVPPTVETLDATDITDHSATLNKNVIQGTYPIDDQDQGFVYQKVEVAGALMTRIQNAHITGLTSGTKYKFWAYAIVEGEEYVGEVKTFTTLGVAPPKPTVTTGEATNVGYTTATLNSTIVADPSEPTTQRGWKYRKSSDTTWLISFVPNLTDLTHDTEYSFRAFASTANYPIVEGSTLTFKTKRHSAPTVKTKEAVIINCNEAKLGMNIAMGSETDIIEKGWWYRKVGEVDWINTKVDHVKGLFQNTNYEFYAYVVTQNYPHNYGDTLRFTTPVCTNIDGVEYRLNIYPNPANEQVTVYVDNLQNGAEVRIVDMLGKTVGSYSIAGGDNKVDIDLSALAEGVYLVRIVSDNNIATERLIINR